MHKNIMGWWLRNNIKSEQDMNYINCGSNFALSTCIEQKNRMIYTAVLLVITLEEGIMSGFNS